MRTPNGSVVFGDEEAIAVVTNPFVPLSNLLVRWIDHLLVENVRWQHVLVRFLPRQSIDPDDIPYVVRTLEGTNTYTDRTTRTDQNY